MGEIFVRYGELGLKSPYVRNQMEKQLAHNIRVFLKKRKIEKYSVDVNRSWGRLIVAIEQQANDEEAYTFLNSIAKDIADNIPGITSTSPVIRSSSIIDDIKPIALEFAQRSLRKNNSFAVRVRRFGKHDYSSKDLEKLLGAVIILKLKEKLNLTVNLTEPDYRLLVEVKDDFAFTYDKKHIGFGGLPQGTQGSLVSIFRGSIQDAVASFLMCKRGVTITPILFQLAENSTFGSNVEELKKQTDCIHLIQPKSKKSHIVIDFHEILSQLDINRLQCSSCDKICLSIVEHFIANQNKKGIILGNADEAILERIPESKLTREILPIYYPLIALDFDEVNHPFDKSFTSGFCLESCPGYKNQKKKEIKPLSDNEIAKIVTSTIANLK
ncbi:MAG: THUMP domain-containing protein [Candidatus Heimdallarchaeota archaeon]